LYLDTGALFRSIALTLKKKFSSIDDFFRLSESEIQVELGKHQWDYAPVQGILVSVDGVDLTSKIREHHVSKLASEFSRHPVIRQFCQNWQYDIVKKHPGYAILEGRDIGTVIFPDAVLKFYVTASSAVRAQRRLDELKQNDPSTHFDFEQIKKDIEDRDFADQNRVQAPLKKADDAIEIDTSVINVDQVLALIYSHINQRLNLGK
jgi:cytidylate kinase